MVAAEPKDETGKIFWARCQDKCTPQPKYRTADKSVLMPGSILETGSVI